jgi:DNA-binding winged helix-turn-helix (wHTH) protein
MQAGPVRDARGSRRMAELLVVNASSFFARQSRLAVVYTERDDAHGLHCEAFLGRERLAVVRASRRLECHPLVTVTVARNRRRAGDAALCLRCGPIAVWPAQHIAQVGNRRVALTKGESAMLLTMLAAEGEPVSRARLTAVWGRPGRPVGGRSVDTRIYALRKKLGDDARDPQLIVTVSGVGYAIYVDLAVEGGGVGRPPAAVWERTTREGQSRYSRVVGTPRTGVA